MKLLGITAHPDDEVGAFGGSLLLCHSRGIQTYVICLTAGEAASNRGKASSREELAKLRRSEFMASCRILHVTEAQMLDYPDGALDRTDFYSVVGDLARRIRAIKPHVVMTMGPEGAITGHRDHSMTSVFTTIAFHWAAHSDRFPEQLEGGMAPHRAQKLYYCTAPFVLRDRQPVSPPPSTITIDISPFMEGKIQATRAHATQAVLMEKFAKTLLKFGSREQFHLAAFHKPSILEPEADLFSNVTDEEPGILSGKE